MEAAKPAAPPRRPRPAADKLWDNVNGGFFNTASNWSGGVPRSGDVARFGITDSSFFQRAYTVEFSNNPFNLQFVVEDDNVTFDLNGHTYTATNSFVAMAIGTVAGRLGNLTLTDGFIHLPFQSDLEIASISGGSGVLTVAGGSVKGAPELFIGLV